MVPLSLLFPRSGNEWMIGEKGGRAWLKASVGGELDKLPSSASGWKFYNNSTREFEADLSLTCRVYLNSPPCFLTVSLSGAAKEAQGQCEGEYKSTGLVSAGRPVFKLEGSIDCYLFVRHGWSDWSIWSDLEGSKSYIISGSAGLRCPASPESKSSRYRMDWSFNTAVEDDDEDDWVEGGVVVSCSVHDQTTARR